MQAFSFFRIFHLQIIFFSKLRDSPPKLASLPIRVTGTFRSRARSLSCKKKHKQILDLLIKNKNFFTSRWSKIEFSHQVLGTSDTQITLFQNYLKKHTATLIYPIFTSVHQFMRLLETQPFIQVLFPYPRVLAYFVLQKTK